MKFLQWTKPIRFNYFKAIKSILDTAVSAVASERGTTSTDIRGQMADHLKTFKEEYFAKRKPENDYPDPLCRLAYLYCYVPANANLCGLALSSEELSTFICEKLQKEEEIKVCSFGGGPGTELLAFAKFLVSKRKEFSGGAVTFTLLDEVEEWAETWTLIEQEIRGFLRANFGKTSGWPFIVSKSFIPFDITKTDGYGSMKHLFHQDLFILSYVVSEIYEDAYVKGLERLLAEMVKAAEVGSKFLIIDRAEYRVKTMATGLFKKLGLTVSDLEESKRNMDTDEECSDLGEHLIKSNYPRLTWNAFWLIGTKT